MYDKKRIFKILVALTVLLSVLLYAAFIFANLHHDCPGENCEICSIIAICRSTIKSFGIALLILSLFTVFSAVAATLPSRRGFAGARSGSLVSMKVKLSN
ncbi:MAG: hypothetical protein J5894_02360 [Clostridia bacterium]|nr:hypothetical protein [Clostridia bacterium]